MCQCGNTVWLGLEGGSISVVNATDGTFITTWSAFPVTISSFCEYQSCVWSGSDNGNITAWFYENNESFYFLNSASPHFSAINCIQKIYNHVWTASNDHSIIIWDAKVFIYSYFLIDNYLLIFSIFFFF